MHVMLDLVCSKIFFVCAYVIACVRACVHTCIRAPMVMYALMPIIFVNWRL